MKTESVKSLVVAFAKANKISATKLEKFAAEVASLSRGNVGKKPKQSTIELRERVKDAVASGNISGNVTAKQLANALGVDMITINNTIRYLSKTENMFEPVGHVDRKPGERGRREVLWAVVS